MNNWFHTKLGSHSDLLTGFPFKSDLYIEDNETRSIRLLRGDNIIQGSIRWTDVKKYPLQPTKELGKYYLQINDLVIAMDRTWVNSGLKISTITECDIPSLLVQRVARLRATEGLIPGYLPYILRSHKFEQYVKAVQTETAVPHISANQIKNFPVLLPPVEEQRRIANVLTKWDSTIALTEKLIVAKRRLKKGLMQQLLTGKRRFPGLAKNESKQAIQIGEVPSDWKTIKISKIAQEVSERAAPEGTPVLSCTKYDGLVPSLEYFGRQVFGDNLDNYKVVKRNQFAYATNHIEEGSIGLLRDFDAGLVSPMYTVFAVITETVDPEFLFAVLKTETYRRLFEALTHASVNRRGSLRWPVFSKIVVAIPTLPEQRKIMSVLKAADREIDLLEEQLRLVKLQKRGLMQKLLTGDIQIPTLDHAA